MGVGLVSSRSGADEDEDMQRQMKLWMEKGHDKVQLVSECGIIWTDVKLDNC